mgnify:CR=1 FL=1
MSAATVAKLVAKDAVSTVVNVKPKRTELPTKPDKKVLFSFKIGETVIERSQPHWTEIFFFIVILVSFAMIGIVSDPNVSATDKDTFATVGGWVGVAVCFILMWYNWGLFDRKRNAESAAYLAEYVTELAAHNKELHEATLSSQENIDNEKSRQEKSKTTLKQLTAVVEQLGDTKTAVSMLKVGLEKFLEQSMKNLNKLEISSRESQVNMMDRGLDRLKELLMYAFYGLDADGSSALEGDELKLFLKKLKAYGIVETKKEFFDTFPLGLDTQCGESDNLIDHCLASEKGKRLSDSRKDEFKRKLYAILGATPETAEDVDLTLTKGEDKEQFMSILVEFGIAKDVDDYVNRLHCIDRYLVNQGMDVKTEQLKALAKTVLVNYDETLIELSKAEAELAKQSPDVGRSKIDFGDDILAAAQRKQTTGGSVRKDSNFM